MGQLTRRSMLKRALFGCAVLGFQGTLGIFRSRRVWAAGSADVDILNFALAKEYLEADIYTRANASGLITDAAERNVFQTLQFDEETHIRLLTTAVAQLGGKAASKPSFHYPATAFGSRASILATAHAVEEAGVGAYLGQAGAIQNPDILQAAAAIYGIECRHAALTALVAGIAVEGGVFNGAKESAISRTDALAALAPFIAAWPATGFAPVST